MRLPLLISVASRLALPAAAMLSAAGAQAQQVYREFDTGWTINQYPEKCTALASFEGDEMLFVTYYPNDQQVLLTFYHPYATSLKEGQEVDMYVKFLIAGELDNGWGRRTFRVGVTTDGGRFLMSHFDANDMLNDLARGTRIAFTLDPNSKRLVTAYNLKGTAVMIKALRECALEAVRRNPRDPFAD